MNFGNQLVFTIYLQTKKKNYNDSNIPEIIKLCSFNRKTN
jgi:hypothetical protein